MRQYRKMIHVFREIQRQTHSSRQFVVQRIPQNGAWKSSCLMINFVFVKSKEWKFSAKCLAALNTHSYNHRTYSSGLLVVS